MVLTENLRTSTVDQNDLRVNSALVVTMLITAFILDRWELVALQAGVLFLTALHISFGPYVALYRHILRPAGIIKPDIRVDHPEPHRFAAMFGTTMASIGAALLASGHSFAGWVLVWVIITLAGAGFAGWCAGCFTYYMLNRLGLRGIFKYSPVRGAFPGVRPPKDARFNGGSDV